MLKSIKNIFPLFVLGFVLLIKFYFLFTAYSNTDFSAEAYKNGDSGHYLTIAKNLHDFHAYADNGTTISNENATWRPPVWPFVLSLFFIFSDSISWILTAKIIFEALLIIGILYLYKKRSNSSWFLLVSFLFLFIEPQYLKYSIYFLSESLNSILMLLMAVLFLTLQKEKKYSYIFPILSAIIVLCHPVSVFFIMAFMGFYCLINLKTHFKISILHGLIFVATVAIWPIRNAIVFHKGIYLTASQGATFSKGWNETVLTNFSNVDGDLADESLNLKYITNHEVKLPVESVLDLGQLYNEGTNNYISSLSFGQKAAIVLKKVKSNFNPFPERPKEGFFEQLAIAFRMLSLILFVQLFIRIFKFRKFNFESQADKAYLITLCIFIGQVAMAAYIYTGFRFNAVNALCLLFCFIVVNQNFIQKQ